MLYFFGFVLSVSLALPAYIASTFLEKFSGIGNVGIFFIGSALVAMIAVNFFPYYIKRFSNYKITLYVLILYFLSIFLLINAQTKISAFIYFSLMTAFTNLLFINMDVFVERFTKVGLTGRVRTVYFTFINAGWLISPFIVGRFVGIDNYVYIYSISAALVVPVFVVLALKKKTFLDHTEYEHHNTLDTIKMVWQNKNLRGAFNISFLLQLFYGVAVIYIPIYLHQYIGFSWATIGIIFTAMLLPFVLIEIPAGIIADKYIGEKEIMTGGLLILSATTFSMFFIHSTNPWLWAGLLFTNRCGAALFEAMRETYFFKMVNIKDVDYVNVFRNTNNLGYLTAAVLGVVVLHFLSIGYIFIFTSLILLSGLYFIFHMKDTK